MQRLWKIEDGIICIEVCLVTESKRGIIKQSTLKKIEWRSESTLLTHTLMVQSESELAIQNLR